MTSMKVIRVRVHGITKNLSSELRCFGKSLYLLRSISKLFKTYLHVHVMNLSGLSNRRVVEC